MSTGMRSGKMRAVLSLDFYADESFHVTCAFYPNGLDDEERVFAAVMERQPDGEFLISDVKEISYLISDVTETS